MPLVVIRMSICGNYALCTMHYALCDIRAGRLALTEVLSLQLQASWGAANKPAAASQRGAQAAATGSQQQCAAASQAEQES
jgi:hypothetical protein